jgi:tetraacyldisaccharide 4'-kinase
MNLFRYFLFPFSFLYYIITLIRNLFFDWGIITSQKLQEPSICIGNLSVGGSGKTPMTIYLSNLLKNDFQVQILSRGYGRKTSGYKEVTLDSTSEDVGDEPLLYKKRFKSELTVAVAEKRSLGANELLKIQTKNSILLLDDAFQHRSANAGFSILLTPFQQIFSSDFLLPVGNLREARCGAKRADCIVITKCPESIEAAHKNRIIECMQKYSKPIFFSSIEYGELISFGAKRTSFETVLLVCGIAQPETLIIELRKKYKVEVLLFADHHNFDSSDIKEIHQKFNTFALENVAIITTEKDYVRLQTKLTADELENYPWYYLPIELKIENEDEFNLLIKKYVTAI